MPTTPSMQPKTLRCRTIRRACAAVGLLVTVSAGIGAQAPARFKTARERISYALGVEAGQQFRSREIDMDPDVFARGLRDALAGKPALSDDQVRAAIAELQAQLKDQQQAIRRGIATQTRAASEAYLEENAKKEGVVTLPSGVQYRVLEAGAGPKPTDQDTVECHYRGRLASGAEFVNSSLGNNSPILKVSEAITGLREALKLMPVGSRWQIVVPPQLATGSRLATSIIPPNEVLIYDVQLAGIKPRHQP